VKILRGGSAEVRPNNWFKFDVELDESDLQAIVVKYGLDYDKLTVIDKYRLLKTQAELLTTIEMEQQGAVGQVSARDLSQQLLKVISDLKATD
jgi:hypothetical protein